MILRPQVQFRFRDVGNYEAVKRAVAKSGLSMNEWLLGLVERELNGKKTGTREVEVGEDGDAPGGHADSGRHGGTASVKSARVASRNSRVKSSAHGNSGAPEPVSEGVSRAGEVEASKLGHDPKTCRIYKCGQCAVLKERVQGVEK